MTLYVENDNLSWDEATQSVTVGSALPVLWAEHLRVEIDNGSAELSWSVSSQSNNEKFVIEHSTDGTGFETIGEIRGAGDAAEKTHYRFSHKDFSEGLNYYRVAQYDYDGSVDYSNVAVGRAEPKQQSFSVFPNPATETITVRRSDDQADHLTIFDAYGRQLNRYAISGTEITLRLPELSAGTYLLKSRRSGEVVRLVVSPY